MAGFVAVIALDHLAIDRIPRDDRERPPPEHVLGAFFRIEPQRRQLRPGSVALEALV